MHRTRLPAGGATQAGAAAETLRSMAGMGIDTGGAAGLTGDDLQRWIDAALDADFEKDFAEFSAERAVAKDGYGQP